ncbi:MAG: hypothetical protein FJY73_11355 [Candidatus Eisenbacteria bacterium]|nr:hypothetical protein [Candidatus Eisenbacteria bacterium]
MRKVPSPETTFIVARQNAHRDLVSWAIEHPAVVAEDFEILATWVPLPDGEEIPILGGRSDGTVSVIDVLEDEMRTFYRQGRIVSFVRSRVEWLRRAFRDRTLDPGRGLHLIVLGEDFSPSFVDAMAGLAVSELVLLRVRDLESSDGRRVVLVERERSRMKVIEKALSTGGLTAEEERFFARLEEERESLRPREGAG